MTFFFFYSLSQLPSYYKNWLSQRLILSRKKKEEEQTKILFWECWTCTVVMRLYSWHFLIPCTYHITFPFHGTLLWCHHCLMAYSYFYSVGSVSLLSGANVQYSGLLHTVSVWNTWNTRGIWMEGWIDQ